MQPPRQHEVRLVITRILRPLPRPTARRAAVPAPPVPLRFTAARLAAHPPPRRSSAPRPPASCSCLTSCLRPPKIPRRGALGIALRVRLSCRPHRTLAQPPPGATASSAVLVTPGASSTPYQSFRAAWSFLRDHLTPRPAVAKSTYRFCVRKIRCAPALQNSCNHRAGESPQPSSGAGRSRRGASQDQRRQLRQAFRMANASRLRQSPHHPPPLAAAGR
jgi:hypothetical protein